MTSGGILRVVQNCDLRPLLKILCSPAGFALIGLLIESDKLILDDGHTAAEVGCTFATEAVICDDRNR